MTSTLREEIQTSFHRYKFPDEKLLDELISISQIYNLKPNELLYKWEAANYNFFVTHSELSILTMDSIVAMKAEIQRQLAQESGKKAQRAMPPGSAAVVNRSRIPPNMARVMNTGAQVGVIRVKEEQNEAGPSKVVFKGPNTGASSRKDRAYRYMYEKISERSEALDDRIDEFGELIREHYEIPELGDPTSSTDEEIVIAGRIACEVDSTSKLTEANIVVESSRMLSSGARIPLRFDPSLKIRGGAQGAGGLGLFPGAIVSLKGKNGSGGWFLVSEILAMPLKAPSAGQSKFKVDPGANDEPFSMCIACGPYTLDADLSYKPWHAFLKIIKTNKPAVVLLTGPFIDIAHPKMKNGDVDVTPSSLFRKQFLEPLRSFLESSPGSIVLILPSVRDVISRQAVFPQSELGPEYRVDPRIHLLPNPALFSLNNISFAVSSVDVLFHLRKEEFVKRGEEVDSIPPSSADDVGTDSMANACRHLLQQRSFYPLFPVPLDVSHEVNLSVSHWDGLKLSDANDTPDILIVPSRLKQFSKAVHSTNAVNPSFLTKGTYAAVHVAGGGTGVDVKDRLNIEIVKIEQ